MTQRFWKKMMGATALCAGLWACSADEVGTMPLQAAIDELVSDLTAGGGAAEVVGPEGGTVEDPATGAVIEIPAGALAQADADDAYVVSVVPYTGAGLKAPGGFALAGTLFDIAIQRVRSRASVQPLAPVRITVPYATTVESDDTARLVVGNFHGSAWVTRATEAVDTEAFLITASFATLSPFGALLRVTNALPVANAGGFTLDEDKVLKGTVTGTDADGNALTFALAPDGQVQHGTLTFESDGSFEYTPAANYNGSDAFSFKVNDGAGDSEAATISITVTPVNDAPTLSGRQVTTVVNTPVTATLVGADVDGAALSYSVVTLPSHGSVAVSASTGVLIYTPATNFRGTDVFYVRANDGAADSDAVAITVEVNGVRRYVRPSAAGSGDGSS